MICHDEVPSPSKEPGRENKNQIKICVYEAALATSFRNPNNTFLINYTADCVFFPPWHERFNDKE